jgi:hypothetical protein
LQENREIEIELQSMKANLSSSQIMCWNCEEVVHAYAARCPYCHKDLTANTAPAAPSPVLVEKIAQIQPIAPSPVVALHEEKVEANEESGFLQDAFTILISLAALLAGSFFFFFGVIIKLFSKNGTFVLEWNVNSWPYFVVSALVLLSLGLYTLSKLEQE